MYTIEKTVTVTADRRLEVILPPEVPVGDAEIVVTVRPRTSKRRTPPPELAARTVLLGDIVSPAIEEDEWECLK